METGTVRRAHRSDAMPHELHGDSVTLTRYRYDPRGKWKRWIAEFIGPDAAGTIGFVEFYGEHVRLMKETLLHDWQQWKPSESADWQPFPQRVSATLEWKENRGLRPVAVTGLIEG